MPTMMMSYRVRPHPGRHFRIPRLASPRLRMRLGVVVMALPLWLAPAIHAMGAAPVAPGAARLHTLEHLVRTADADALHALQGARQDVLRGASYDEHIAYLRLLRQAYTDNGDAASAADTDERIAQLATAQGDDVNAALGQLGRIGRLAARSPAEALGALSQLDARYAQVRAPEFTAPLQQAYGDIYVLLGQFDFALNHYLKAQDLCRRNPHLLNPTVNGLRLALARVYVYMKAPDKVLAVLAEIRPADGAVPPRSAARAFGNQGIAYGMLGQSDRARGAYREGLAIARTYNLTQLEANALGNIADSYLQDQNWNEAERNARAALAVSTRVHDIGAMRIARVNIGFALAGRGDVAQGLTYIDAVVAGLRADDSLPDLANILGEKSRMLERAGWIHQSLKALQEERAVAARLAAAERESAVSMMQEQFNAQRRAAQIDGLRRDNVLKDEEIRKRRMWQMIASIGAAVALALCGFVYLLYQRSVRASACLRTLNDELAYHSTHDALTGLLNRRSLREAMAAASDHVPTGAGPAAHAVRGSQCFILLDIDHFKAINDRLGHGAGDAVLVEVARRLREAVGARGQTLRWGGEEFLVYAEGGSLESDARLVRDLLNAIGATPVPGPDGEALPITISAGALTLAPDAPSLDWEQALALADQALYLGKQNGRNRAYLAEAGRAGPTQLRLTLIEPGAAQQTALQPEYHAA